MISIERPCENFYANADHRVILNGPHEWIGQFKKKKEKKKKKPTLIAIYFSAKVVSDVTGKENNSLTSMFTFLHVNLYPGIIS